ncbi:hypothetical protein H0H87_009973 [Tephrocybe sp. NHM501043]|nr:hypothetical protein H0H87_009973 [Tephrocybe sp. NHM501043]
MSSESEKSYHTRVSTPTDASDELEREERLSIFSARGPRKEEFLTICINAAAVRASLAAKRLAEPVERPTKRRLIQTTCEELAEADSYEFSKAEAHHVQKKVTASVHHRQRNREEFKRLKIRVAELEEENARPFCPEQARPFTTSIVERQGAHRGSKGAAGRFSSTRA